MNLISILYAMQFMATFVLIIAGGLVTGTGSGLAVPDWPLSFGTLFPEMTGGVLYEHSHRLIAGGVLVLALTSTVRMLFEGKIENRLKNIAVFSLILVLLQALLGGLTVILKLPTWTSASHAVLGPSFLALIGYLFAQCRKIAMDRSGNPAAAYTKAGTGASFVIFFWLIWAQYLLGALARHGVTALIPYHALLGTLLLFHYLGTAGKATRLAREKGAPKALLLIHALSGMLLAQVLLGVFSWMAILTHPSPELGNWHRIGVTSAHQSLAALILTSAFLLAYSSFRIHPTASGARPQ